MSKTSSSAYDFGAPAKRLMREYNTSLDGMLTIEMVFQPIQPLRYIAVNLKVEP